MKNCLFISLMLSLFSFSGQAQSQLEINADIRSRLQVRNGYRQLRPDGVDPVAVIFQRNRLNVDYKYKDLVETFFSVQDIRLWGQQGQFDDIPNVGLFQAWGEVKLSPRWKLKVGRQRILFDDGYLFGWRTWREGGFAHDAVVAKYKDSTFEAQAVLALNQSRASNTPTTLTSNIYKNLQVLWFKKYFGKSDVSFIFVNRALQRLSDTTNKYMQTFGPTLNLRIGPATLKGYFYYQVGQDTLNLRMRSHTWSAKLDYPVLPTWRFLLGVDVLSGTDVADFTNPSFADNRTFDNLYAYRHRYFGHMDYFYVGFNPQVGLQDFMFNNEFKLNDKLTTNVDFHSFFSHARLIDFEDNATEADKYLGFEVDLAFKYQLYDWVTVRGGYAQLFGSRSLEVLNVRGSNGDKDNLTNWLWLEIRFTPQIFKGKFQ